MAKSMRFDAQRNPLQLSFSERRHACASLQSRMACVVWESVRFSFTCLTRILPQTLDLALVTGMTRALQNEAQSGLCWQERFLGLHPSHTSRWLQSQSVVAVFPKTHRPADSTRASAEDSLHRSTLSCVKGSAPLRIIPDKAGSSQEDFPMLAEISPDFYPSFVWSSCDEHPDRPPLVPRIAAMPPAKNCPPQLLRRRPLLSWLRPHLPLKAKSRDLHVQCGGNAYPAATPANSLSPTAATASPASTAAATLRVTGAYKPDVLRS